jgi:L-aspartate oxidase
MTTQEKKVDFLVVGAGIAGLRATIELATAGNVLVLVKDDLHESSSGYAQGGIAAAVGPDDGVDLHAGDTLVAGDGICNADAVRMLVKEAPNAIQELISWGAEFDHQGSRLQLAREGAHSRNRVLHSHGDSTGREIARALYRKAASLENVEFRRFASVTDLAVDDNGSVVGAVAFDERSQRVVEVKAHAVLLATGGLGRVYRDTTNPDVAAGDGVAMAFRAGAEIRDLEFVQFHPTALRLPGAPRFLLSEALRGEGAVLRNVDGQRFMERYHPLKELAPRDVVSRAIVLETHRLGSEYVLLDLTHLDSSRLRTRFPRIYETCLRYGVDITRHPVAVFPAAHYSMGGVRTDLDGRTTVDRLFAAGEAACNGLHGANRLASNSLLEAVVFGAQAGRSMRDTYSARTPALKQEEPLVPVIEETELRTLASTYCGILRNGLGLEKVRDKLSARLVPMTEPSRTAYELRNMYLVVWLIACCALARCESRGGHYRTDFPQKDPAFQKHSVISSQHSVRLEPAIEGARNQ